MYQSNKYYTSICIQYNYILMFMRFAYNLICENVNDQLKKKVKKRNQLQVPDGVLKQEEPTLVQNCSYLTSFVTTLSEKLKITYINYWTHSFIPRHIHPWYKKCKLSKVKLKLQGLFATVKSTLQIHVPIKSRVQLRLFKE